MKPILVQMSTPAWTRQAIHFASAMARNDQTKIILLRMIPVTHPEYLGTDYGYCEPTFEEQHAIDEYAATAEDYCVTLILQPMQYINALDAVAEAAEALDAGVVFAHVPESFIPFLQKFRIWWLKQHLHQRRLFTLTEEKRDNNQVPFITNTPAHTTRFR
jgi:hypothetical protein